MHVDMHEEVKRLWNGTALRDAIAQMQQEGTSRSTQIGELAEHGSEMGEMLAQSFTAQTQRILRDHGDRSQALAQDLGALARMLGQSDRTIFDLYGEYLKDAGRRMILTADVLRERGDVFLEHEAAGCPPVLDYDYEIALDGRDLERPCNYQLLRILPPEGITIDDTRRPYMIIDPRAGHGGGIGGFKQDSQVGIALKTRHPVYFVNFTRDPVDGQTLADVCAAEASFVREVQRRHPHSKKAVVLGNCQGGWATLILAATNPDITGPVVLNGAPVLPWSGKLGENPMRYNAGILGGLWQPMMWSDLGGGKFDGASLVANFEQLNPSRNFFGKYFDLYQDPEGARERFIDFERWWGGFFVLNEAEIHWIVEQLFVGNKLAKNQAQLEPGRNIDIKAIKAPVVVFASHGDNITPPQQALNWIIDSYADAEEIAIRGQRIIYMVHEQVGHLGIFVSSSVARKEHAEMESVMGTIESLSPGLYEMVIEDVVGEGDDTRFTVSFARRNLDDLSALDDGRAEEAGMAAVARLSEIQAQTYELALRPTIRAMVTPQMAETMRSLHPLRQQRAMASSLNPAMNAVQMLTNMLPEAEAVPADNPFVVAERLGAQMIEQSLDLWRDMRDAAYEASFLTLWTNPAAIAFGKPNAVRRTLKSHDQLRGLPTVTEALERIEEGGLPEAITRMLVMMGNSRGEIRADRLQRAASILANDPPFADLHEDTKAEIIRRQTLIANFEPDLALAALDKLVTTKADREKAVKAAQYVAGKLAEMTPETRDMLTRIRAAVHLPAAKTDILTNPLAAKAKPTKSDAA